jgi:uncharacterized membrane protein YgaE (UPF0421/DUF939 family)
MIGVVMPCYTQTSHVIKSTHKTMSSLLGGVISSLVLILLYPDYEILGVE